MRGVLDLRGLLGPHPKSHLLQLLPLHGHHLLLGGLQLLNESLNLTVPSLLEPLDLLITLLTDDFNLHHPSRTCSFSFTAIF